MRILLITFFIIHRLVASSQDLRVGVYHNPPLIIIEETGDVSGFSIDILKEIAIAKGWKLDYIEYNFSEALIALENGEIELIPVMAYSEERDSIFILNHTNLLTNWGKIYKNEDDGFSYSSLEQLKDKTIAVLKGDFYLKNGENGLLDLIEKLGLNSKVIEYNSYDAVISGVADRATDLGLVSRYYGTLQTEGKDVVKTPINIAYVGLRYAFYNSEENLLIATDLDQKLHELINKRGSVYYESEKKYLTFESQAFIPPWLWKFLIIVALGLVVLAIFIVLLQYQVKRKTSDLLKTNKLLIKSEREASLAERTIEASQDIGFWFKPGQPFIRVNQAAVKMTGFSEQELLRMTPRDLLATDKNLTYYDSLREGEWAGHLLIEDSFKTKAGEAFPVELSLDQFELNGETYICGFARNISIRVRAERELVERNKELNCLYTISQLISDRDKSIENIFRDSLKAIMMAWQFPEIIQAKITHLGKEYLSENYQKSPWLLKATITSGDIEVGEVEVGYIEARPEEEQGPFLKEEVSLINAIGKEFASMLDSRDAERKIIATILSTEDKERNRISKELHDSVGQTLSAISLHIDALAHGKSILNEDKEKVLNIEKLLKEAIKESRSISHNLMPPSLTELGISYAIENLLSSLEDVGQTAFKFNSNESTVKISKEFQFALYRVTQEAINNILKYAKAKEATIQYLVFEDHLSLSIEDDGIGFDLNIINKKHNFGLNSMRNRASSIGAEFTIETSPGKGTGIYLNLPLTSKL